MACHNTIKTVPRKCCSITLRQKSECINIKKIWNEVESQLFEKLATEVIEVKGSYVYGKLKMWKERLKTNFHGEDVPYNMYCNATAVLKIDSVYKKVKIIILRYMLKSVNTSI